jgi:hypothetical protein
MRDATSPIASSHDASRKRASPFGPVRTRGVKIRSGAYTRRAWCFTLWQM